MVKPIGLLSLSSIIAVSSAGGNTLQRIRSDNTAIVEGSSFNYKDDESRRASVGTRVLDVVKKSHLRKNNMNIERRELQFSMSMPGGDVEEEPIIWLDEKELQWLNEHNTRRKTYHEAYGVSYKPLKWSSGLTNLAQSWANQNAAECRSGSLASALGSAFVKAVIALAGRFALNPMFKTVASANSQEAFLGLVLLTAMGMSFLTEGLGLSNTLGAFLAGVLLSETKYRYQVEADIAPFRGILLGLFFVTVGFEIDLGLIANNLPVVSGIVAGILTLKAGILTLLSKAFGLSTSNALRTGLILSQGGECK